jgi:fructoselysine-6-P-deglycase FrlB-like protein
MLREIFEQPATLSATIARYVDGEELCADTCAPILDWLQHVHNKIVIAASGSSRHAGQLAELILEDLSGIPVDVEYASEYSYRSEKALSNTAVMVISQSGETADTLAALRKANLVGNQTLAITNVDDSTMEREATVSFPTVAGRERAIPATKSFTAQLLNLYLLALMAAVSRDLMDAAQLKQRLAEVAALPGQIEMQLRSWEESMHSVAYQYREAKNFLFLGRGIHYPIAREGALKLKESAYLHAEQAIELIETALATNPSLRETDSLRAMELGARRIDFIGLKFQLSDEMRDAYAQAYDLQHDRKKDSTASNLLYSISSMNGRCQDLRDVFSQLKNLYRDSWLAENRPYWIDNVLVRYDLQTQLWQKRGETLDTVIDNFYTTHALPPAAQLGIPAPASTPK